MPSTDAGNQGIKRKHEESLEEVSEISNKNPKIKKKSKFHSLMIFLFISWVCLNFVFHTIV